MTFIPATAFGLGTSGIYHVGHVVADLDEAMARFTDARCPATSATTTTRRGDGRAGAHRQAAGHAGLMRG
jgi:hypothetical protein